MLDIALMASDSERFLRKNVLTIAVCGSAKKHRQSFEALKCAAVKHNTLLRQGETRSSASLRPHVGSTASSQSCLVPPCFFRIANLSYDERHQRMLLDPRLDVTEDSTEEGNGLSSHRNCEDRDYVLFLEKVQKFANRHLSCPLSMDTKESFERQRGVSAALRPEEVDIVLQKVISYGLPRAIDALHEWCNEIRQLQSSLNRQQLIVVDPINKVQVLSMRFRVYMLLENARHRLALTPRTFRLETHRASCDQKYRSGLDVQCDFTTDADRLAFFPTETQNSTLSVVESQKTRNNFNSPFNKSKWWIAKPDESTGPSYTHDFVIWKSLTSQPYIPFEVQAALASQPSAYIIQEFYTYAFPVVVKVYCAGKDIFIKVKPTNNLLTCVLTQTHSKDDLVRPVKINSQNKDLFTLDGPSHIRTPHWERRLLDQSFASMLAPNMASKEQAHIVTRDLISPYVTKNPPSETPFGSAGIGECWETFFAPGTAAQTAMRRIAERLSGHSGFGLTLYGFDILLVPSALAQIYQLEDYTKGVGYTEGATVEYKNSPVECSNFNPHHPASMFDLRTGAPTTYLVSSVPVVIDINYFPSYSGLTAAVQGILKLMWDLYAEKLLTK